MLGDILHFHRTEGAKADMQGYMGDLYTGILYLLQKLFCKVQSCGRSGCASLVFRVYRLVAVLVLQFVCAGLLILVAIRCVESWKRR